MSEVDIRWKEASGDCQLKCDDSDTSADSDSRIESDGFLSHPKCGTCRKKLPKSVLDPRCRTCSMCGELFCYQCTVYRRKLSRASFAMPDNRHRRGKAHLSSRVIPDDVFGSLYSVCQPCYVNEGQVTTGVIRDLMEDFRFIRRGNLEAEGGKAKEDSLCCRLNTASPFKRQAVVKEIDRLVKGFTENPGFIREIISEISIPNWQKSANWMDSSDVSHCFHCKTTFKYQSTKTNCRIGGQVFCTKCSQDEMVVYLEKKDGKPMWGVNRKCGAKTTELARYELYKVCTVCSENLQAIFYESNAFEVDPQVSSFMDSMSKIQQSLVQLQEKVAGWLPDYIQGVESLYSTTKMSNADKKKLAKLHFDLTSTQSVIKERQCSLQKLQPHTPKQKILLKHAQKGIKTCFDNDTRQMADTRELLTEDVIDELSEVQKMSSRTSMEKVTADVYQMVADASEYRKRLNLYTKILDEAEKILSPLKEEFLRTYPWKENYEAMMLVRRETFRITDSDRMTRETVQGMLATHCSIIAHKCCLHLEANTLEHEFKKTKNCLKNACVHFATFNPHTTRS